MKKKLNNGLNQRERKENMNRLEELKWQLNHVITLQNQVESRCQTFLIVLGGMFVLMIPKVFPLISINLGATLLLGSAYFYTLFNLYFGVAPVKLTEYYFLNKEDEIENPQISNLFISLYQKALDERKKLYHEKEIHLKHAMIGFFCLILGVILLFTMALI